MSKAQEAQQFLQDLDNFDPVSSPSSAKTATGGKPAQTGQPGEAADVIAFLDEITQKSSEPTRTTTTHLERPGSRSGTPSLRKSTERVRMGVPSGLTQGASSSPSKPDSASSSKPTTPKTETAPTAPQKAAGGWGWGSVWSTANTVMQQAKSVVDEQRKNLPSNEQTSKWSGSVLEYAKNAQEYAKNAQEYAKTSAQEYAKSAQEYAKTAQLDKLSQDLRKVGLSTFTDILNVVAPPIADHEVLQVWLSHDMEGYEGVESVVYKALARIMEQVEGGDLVVNRGDESKPKAAPDASREMHAVEGLEAAIKLAQANIEEMKKRDVKHAETKESSTEAPITYSHIYLRVQPYKTSYSIPLSSSDGPQSRTENTLQFLLYLSDPGHGLVHSTTAQSVPESWLAVWDKYDWVEDSVVDAIRQGVEVLGQDYIARRMSWIAGEAEEPKKDGDDDDDDDEEEEESESGEESD